MKLETFDSSVIQVVFDAMKAPDLAVIQAFGFHKVLKRCKFLKFDLVSKIKAEQCPPKPDNIRKGF